MAGLTHGQNESRASRATQERIPAGAQFAAVAYLRWRLFANAFRRKGGKGELVARIIGYPIGLILLLIPVLGAGSGAYFGVRAGHLSVLTGIFWALFLLQVLVSINVSAPGLSFEPQSLIRFPLTFTRYLVIRIFLGLLAASNVTGTVSLLAAALGASLARPQLAAAAFAAAAALAITNMLFVRMIYAWIDRWLSTRRAREFFTGFIVLFSLGIQYLNLTFNNIGGHGSNTAAQARKVHATIDFYHRAQPVLDMLPPGLAGRAVLAWSAGLPGTAAVWLAGVLLFAAVFLAVFAWRMGREYRGENLSEANATPLAPGPAAVPQAAQQPSPALHLPSALTQPSFLSPVIAACLQKEAIYLRRNVAQFYGVMAPVLMVVLFAGRMGHMAKTGLIFPAAMAYAFLGVATLSYNSLGLDANGVATYFLAPIHMRDVFVAKNLFGFAIILCQAVLVYAIVLFMAGPPPLAITLATLCWVLFAAFANTTVGNMRSLSGPKKMDPNKVSRRQASGLSALLSIGLMLTLAGLGVGLLFLARMIQMPWMPVPVLLALAIGAFALYYAGLNRIDSIAYHRRETILEELSKTA